MSLPKLRRIALPLVAALFLSAPTAASACEGVVAACDKEGAGSFALIFRGRAVPVIVAPGADPAVRHAAGTFAEDVGRVGGNASQLVQAPPEGARQAVIVGVAGQGGLVDRLAGEGRIDLSQVTGRWEAFGQFVVDDPLPGVERALVVAGADPRGAVYGLYDLSERIGVSPWHWWADVPVVRRETLYLTAGARTDAPGVRYRGFFINDEEPALGEWARTRFGGINAGLYEQVFELLLRLKGNYLWPAMWGKSLAEDDPASLALAAEMGVVLGTSHHEPLTRAHVEWERAKERGEASGAWNYETNAPVLRRFWREGMERFVASGAEGVVTIGMRGDGDEAMSEDTAIPLLERIVADQRAIIAETTGKPASETPQVWALYKEVQDYYDQGMRVPDDVTLLFADDNWGQIRRLPDPSAPPRAGGYGVYYHFDYVGGPRSYKWIDTIQNGKTWQQMNLAWERGARDLWIVNVGDIKPAEMPLDFFLDMAWDPDGMTPERLDEYSRDWARQQFGEEHADEVAAILDEYSRLVSRRKPELLDADSMPLPMLEKVTGEWDALVALVEALAPNIPEASRSAFFQLVQHRVQGVGNLYALYRAVAVNRAFARANIAGTDEFADRAEQAFARDRELSEAYHAVSGGKWNHMMSQSHIGYTAWNDPPENIMPEVTRLDAPGRDMLLVSRVIPHVTIPAARTAALSNLGEYRWQTIPELGSHGSALTVLPQGRPATTVAEGIYAEYALEVPSDGDWTLDVNLVPTLDTLGDEGLRFGLQVGEGPVEEKRFLLSPTNGSQDTPAEAAWVRSVIANKVTMPQVLGRLPKGTQRVRIYRIDDNVVLDELVLRPTAEN